MPAHASHRIADRIARVGALLLAGIAARARAIGGSPLALSADQGPR